MSSIDRDLVHDLAELASRVSLDDLPEAAVDAAKKSILDAVGVALAASGTEPALLPLIDLSKESGGYPDSRLWGMQTKVPATTAAFLNGAMTHSLDFDDQTPWGQHSSSTIVPAALAVAERRGGVRGADLIAAVAVGQDLFARLRCNVGWRKDWNLSTVLGVYAGTVAAGHVVGLSAVEMTHALGIASMQSSGVMEVVAGTGSDLRGMYGGFSAKGAVLATLLAQRGVKGVDSLFEGEHGVFRTYFAGDYSREAILQDLGTVFLGAGTLYKRWPAVGTAHSHIHATIEIMATQGLRPDDVEEIRVFVGDYHDLMSRPLNERRSPATAVDAKFSLPYLVAVAALRGDVVISDFSTRALADLDVQAMARRVVPVADPTLDWKVEIPPGRVQILTSDGRAFERAGTNVPGNAEAPLSWGEISRKFSACASAALIPPQAIHIESAIELVRDLERLNDATDFLRVLDGEIETER